MAYSNIENKYLSALTAVQFPDLLPEPAAVDQQPSLDGVQLAMGGNATGRKSDRPMTDVPMALFDTSAGVVRGAVAQTLGLPGDIQMLYNGLKSIFNRPEDQSRLDAFAKGLNEGTLLPTTEQMGKILPPVVPPNAPDAAMRARSVEYGQTFGELAPLPGAIDAGVAGLKYGTKKLGPTAAGMVVNSMEKLGTPLQMNVVPPGPNLSQATIPLTRQEKSVVIAAGKRNQTLRQTATSAIENLHANYPVAEGWTPIEANKITFKQSKSGDKLAEVETAKIPYDFHTPPEGVPKDAWQASLSAGLVDEVQNVVNRATAGDTAAIEILNQASWYRSMRDRLRAEFGGIGDVFADVLGTTSAQTGVEHNFDNAVEILRRFSRGEYNNELAAFEKRIASGKPIDGKTLTEMYKNGEFPLITKAGGQLFNANSPSSMGALLDMFRAIKAGDSPKTPNFTGNLIGLTNEATIDVWAARMLRRLADLPRIPPPAEKGVAGKHLVGSTLYDPKVGSEFGFGQDVFREAADEINKSGMLKSVAPQIGDLGPDDLQAVAWFIEKENWTKNGWTTKAGEGGSLDFEMSFAGAADPQAVKDLRRDINAGFKPPAQRKTETDADYAKRVQDAKAVFNSAKAAKQQQLTGMEADVNRYTLGVSGERPNKPMSNYGQAELAAEFDDVVRNDPSVVTYNLANTYGSFMAQTERAINAEFVTRQNFNPAPLERRLIEQGKAYDQDAVFISKVMRDGSGPNSRPGVEIYFKQKITADQMAKVTEKLRQYGVDGFTYVTDMRFNDRIDVQAKAGAPDTAGLNGLRFQYIPEFDDAYSAANRVKIMQEKEDLFRDVVNDIMTEGNVSDARVVYYDTKVYFRSDYDEYLARTAGTGNSEARGAKPSSANVAQPDRSGEVEQDFSRAVSNRLRKKASASKSPTVNRGNSAPQSGAE